MEWKIAAAVFGTVFLAELGDKTQLATLMYAADGMAGRWTVFVAAAAALVLSSALAVLAGAWLSHLLSPRVLHWAAGLGFIAIGAFTLWRS